MSKTVINSVSAPEPIGPYSQAIKAGGNLYVSGQIAIDRATGKISTDNIVDEAKQVMDNIGHILKEAGYGFNDIVKTTIFLKDMNNFPKVNEVYGKYFSERPPARETVEVSRLPKDVNVEISCIAFR